MSPERKQGPEDWLRETWGRIAGGVLVLVLAGLAVLTAPGASLESRGDTQGIVGLELVGNGVAAARWTKEFAGSDAIHDALTGDVWFILCYAPLLALLAFWAGQNYRTVPARRLARPVAFAALGAGVLDLLENACLEIGLDGFLWFDQSPVGWRAAAVFSWAKWVILFAVVLYVLGGLLSLLAPAWVRNVLREADTATLPPSKHTKEKAADLGLAFSGGGIRAASISLGALQSLESDNTMGWGKAANVTSVSGGSYMAGGWSVARAALATAPDDVPRNPQPWAAGDVQPGPEEQHLRANLGYLLANAPRGLRSDTMSTTLDEDEELRARRQPAVFATVLTGMLVNALILLGILWAISQPLGWFYRWYFGLGVTCKGWRIDVPLLFAHHHDCLTAPLRVRPPILWWAAAGLAFILIWVLVAKVTENLRRPPAVLLVFKYFGFGFLALAGVLMMLLAVLPLVLELLWKPIERNDLVTTLVTVLGAVGSFAAVPRILRKPLAKLAPVLGGFLFGALLLFLVCRWTLGAMTADPDARRSTRWLAWAAEPADRPEARWLVVVVLLLLVHLIASVEWWSLAAFYRGKLRSAFGTYRAPSPDGSDDITARAYRNGSKAVPPAQAEPALSSLPVRAKEADGTPLTVCASATVTGREVRTHYGIPALSVTFSPSMVRTFEPRDEDGSWTRHQCPTDKMERLMPQWLSPRLTTMLAVGVSGAAVSPAMGRFRVGPVSMLLTFANVRLGMWIPNPRYAEKLADLPERRTAWQRRLHVKPRSRLPRPRLGYLMKEFFGFHDPSDLYLYVTDGGHWENTALVELLRTHHHRELVCVDADSGPGNLAGSISKAIDLAQLECAATIALNLDVLRSEADASPGRDYSPRSVNLGLVRRTIVRDDDAQADGDAETDRATEQLSVLWYCKPALTADMPPKLLAYREVDPTFPRVNTVNQFFHVAQFEAYRDLGRYNANKIKAARETLATLLAADDFAAFREAVATTSDPEPPEAWVLDELVGLIQDLAGGEPTAERAAYESWLYAEVRQTLTGIEAPQQTAPA